MIFQKLMSPGAQFSYGVFLLLSPSRNTLLSSALAMHSGKPGGFGGGRELSVKMLN